MDAVIEREPAEKELEGILAYFGIGDEKSPDQVQNREKIIQTIMKGRVLFDENTGEIILTLGRPIELQNGQQIKELKFREPTAGDLKTMDNYKPEAQMARAIALISKVTGHPIGVVDRIGSQDLQVITAVVTLFT